MKIDDDDDDDDDSLKEVRKISWLFLTCNRPVRQTQCCTQFKSFGNKTFCFRNFYMI